MLIKNNASFLWVGNRVNSSTLWNIICLGAYITRYTTAEKVMEILNALFTLFSPPVILPSDIGLCCSAESLKKCVTTVGVRHSFITALRPQANGKISFQNRSLLKSFMFHRTPTRKEWWVKLHTYVFAYYTVPERTTGVSLSQLLFSSNIHTKFLLLNILTVKPPFMNLLNIT